jgi:hypothetical protein
VTYKSLVGFVVLLSLVACRPSARPVTTTSDDGSSTSASSQAAAKRDHSLVRVVNAMSSGPRLAVLADERTLFDGVASREVTRYRELDEDMVTFSVRPSAEPAANSEAGNREILSDGARYTAVILPGDKAGQMRIKVLTDDPITPEGKARVRVIQAAEGAGDVDLVFAGRKDNLFGGVSFAGASAYQNVDPTNGRLEVRRGGETLVLATLKDLQLSAGVSTTIVITGGPKGPLHLTTFEDRPGPPEMAASQ